MAINWNFSEALLQAYAPTQPRQTDYFSPEFRQILQVINETLAPYGVPQLTYETSRLTQSQYDFVPENGSKLMWRVTSDMVPALSVVCQDTVLNLLSSRLKAVFPKYFNKIVKINLYQNKTKASIVILPCGLSDNTWTSVDLQNYYTDFETKQKLDEIERRMFRRAGDTRDSESRWSAYIDADYYEKVLPKTQLINIGYLQATHSLINYSLEPQSAPDFIGVVLGKRCTVEAKSKKNGFSYQNSTYGKYEFAEYWNSIKTELGSLHDANFILLIDKIDGKIICLERLNPVNNWLAGYIELKEN